MCFRTSRLHRRASGRQTRCRAAAGPGQLLCCRARSHRWRGLPTAPRVAIGTRLQRRRCVAIGRSARRQAMHARGASPPPSDGRAPANGTSIAPAGCQHCPTKHGVQRVRAQRRSGGVEWAGASGPPAERVARRDASLDAAGRALHLPTAHAASIVAIAAK